MKTTAKLLLALTTATLCVTAGAEPFDQADQARRDRNREEAIAHHDKETLRERTHVAAEATRNFTHRQVEKLRRFGAKHHATPEQLKPQAS
jgi:hypothetical protein